MECSQGKPKPAMSDLYLRFLLAGWVLDCVGAVVSTLFWVADSVRLGVPRAEVFGPGGARGFARSQSARYASLGNQSPTAPPFGQ